MRNPSLHVRKTDLVQVLKELKVNYAGGSLEELAEELLRKCRRYEIRNRYILNVSDKKKAEKLVKNREINVAVTEKFNGVLVATRVARNHKFIRQIKKHDKEYEVLKDIARDAAEFADMFELSPEQGYKHFCSIGLRLMGKKYGLSKFKFYKERIFDLYEKISVIDADTDPEGTEELYEIWKLQMVVHTNMELDLKTDPTKYVNFVYAREEADEIEADYADWVVAQFEGLAYLNAVPEAVQLHGEGARDRYQRYLVTQNKLRPDEIDATVPTKFNSDAEKEYWEAIKNKKHAK